MYYQNQFIDGQDNNYPTRELADKSEKVLRNGQWLNRIGCVEKKGTLLYDVEIDEEEFDTECKTYMDAYNWAVNYLADEPDSIKQYYPISIIEKIQNDDTLEIEETKYISDEVEYDGYDAEKEYKLNVFGRAS